MVDLLAWVFFPPFLPAAFFWVLPFEAPLDAAFLMFFDFLAPPALFLEAALVDLLATCPFAKVIYELLMRESLDILIGFGYVILFLSLPTTNPNKSFLRPSIPLISERADGTSKSEHRRVDSYSALLRTTHSC